jgi:hypothetical protein
MTYKEFKKSFESLRGFIKHRTFYYHQMEVQYAPARALLEIRLPHTFIFLKAYSKRQDATYIYITNKGIINFGLSDDDQGVVLKLHGDVSGKKIQNKISTSKNMLKLIDDMYNDRVNRSIGRKDDEYEDEYEACNN